MNTDLLYVYDARRDFKVKKINIGVANFWTVGNKWPEWSCPYIFTLVAFSAYYLYFKPIFRGERIFILCFNDFLNYVLQVGGNLREKESHV